MVLKGCKKVVGKGLQIGFAALLISGLLPTMVKAETAATAAAAPTGAAVAPAAPAAPAGPQEKGDPNVGRMLFTGEKVFANGGPACISCHSAGVGDLGGGILGPDLSKVYSEPSTNPLVNGAWINSDGTPVMGPIFSNRNVTDEEVDALRAFFEQQAKNAPATVSAPPALPASGIVTGNVSTSATSTFTVIGLGGFIGILIVFNIIWSGRYRNRNKGTAHEAIWRNYGGKGGR
jgi:quinol---cytochrome-c reductase cytochrome c subunit